MVNSIKPNNNQLTYGAIKDVPQNVKQKIPEVQNSAKETVDDSFIGSTTGGIVDVKGMKPWQIALSVVGAVAVVFGGSALLRKFVNNNGIFKVSDKLDDFYEAIKEKKIVKGFGKIKDKFSSTIGKKIKESSFGKLFAKNSAGVRSNMAEPSLQMAKGFVKGSKNESCDTIADALHSILKGNKEDGIRSKFLKNIGEKIGWVKKGGIRFSGEDGLRKLIKDAGHGDKADDLIKLVKDYATNSGDTDLKALVKDSFMPVLEDYFKIGKSGKFFDRMASAVNKDFRQRVCQGLLTHEVDMLNAYKNMLILDGKGANSPLGRAFQKFLLKAVEAPTNGIMSRSKMGLAMALGIYFGIFNDIQKAPKGEKISTTGEKIVGDIGGYMMIPVNAGIVYSMASLKNLGVDAGKFKTQLKDINKRFAEATSGADKEALIQEFKNLKKATYKEGTILQKILRVPGKILSTGLDKGPGASKVKGVMGGSLRFIMAMLVISAITAKPIMAVSRKIFGKTSKVKEEEANAKAKKEAKKQAKMNPTPALNTVQNNGMTKEELAQKLMAHPDVLQKLQADPTLLEAVSKNPQMLEDMFKQSEAINKNNVSGNMQNASIAQNMAQKNVSPALKNYLEKNNGVKNAPQNLNNASNQSGQNVMLNNNVNKINQPKPFVQGAENVKGDNQKTEKKEEKFEQKTSYIPSSEPVKINHTLTSSQQFAVNKVMLDYDMAEQEALKGLME